MKEVFAETDLQKSLTQCLIRIMNSKDEEEQLNEIIISPMLFEYIKNPSEKVTQKYIELKLAL